MEMQELRSRIKEVGIQFKTIADRLGIKRQYYNQLIHFEKGVKDNVKMTLRGLKAIYSELGKLIKEVEKNGR